MPRMADYKLGITRLAARIKDLKYAGIFVEGEMQYVGPVRFKKYWIPKETCKAYHKHKLLKEC
jgi:hypothetical protein